MSRAGRSPTESEYDDGTAEKPVQASDHHRALFRAYLRRGWPRRVGFGQDSLSAPPPVISFDPSYDKAYNRCTNSAWLALSDHAKQVYYSYFDLGNKLNEPLMRTINDRMGDTSWRKLLSCITGKGYRVEDERAFLQAPIRALFGVPVGVVTAEDQWQPKAVPGTVG